MTQNFEMGELPLEKIKPDANQPRHDFDKEELAAMAEGIKHQGIINPIEIDENNVIIDGERRWRAAKMAGLKVIPYKRKILKELLKSDPHYRTKRQLQANITGRHLKIIEARQAIEKLLGGHINVYMRGKHSEESLSKLAKELGVSQPMLSLILKLDRVGSESLKEAVASGTVAFGTATEIAQLDDKNAQDELVDYVTNEPEKQSREKVRELVKYIKEAPTETEDIIETDKVLAPIVKEAGSAINAALKKISKIEKPNEQYANFLFMQTIDAAVKRHKIFCPDCKNGKGLKWACCGEDLSTKIDKLLKTKFKGGKP